MSRSARTSTRAIAKSTLNVALCQIAPIWLQREATLAKIVEWVGKAAKANAGLAVFGEALVPGYPFWVERTDGAKFESDIQKALYAHYVAQAISIEGGDLKSVCDACKRHGIAVYLGIMERAANRGGHSVYACMVYIDADGEIRSAHRKLMPTHEERLVWAIGDGHGLRTHSLGPFTAGGLNCWENWLPLARAALYGQGEDLHVAIWPGSLRNTEEITRFIAKESRSFVVSVSGLMRRQDIGEDLPMADLLRESADDIMANGGSCIATPAGEWLLEPEVNEESLRVATLEHRRVLEERHSLDVAGHYSRPDVTRLTVNRKRQQTTDFDD